MFSPLKKASKRASKGVSILGLWVRWWFLNKAFLSLSSVEFPSMAVTSGSCSLTAPWHLLLTMHCTSQFICFSRGGGGYLPIFCRLLGYTQSFLLNTYSK